MIITLQFSKNNHSFSVELLRKGHAAAGQFSKLHPEAYPGAASWQGITSGL